MTLEVIVRVTKNLTVAAAACALDATAAFAPSAGAPSASSLSTARTRTSSTYGGADVVLHPGVLQPRGARSAGPPTTAQCEKAYRIACYEPSQIRQAYRLPAL